MKLIQSKMKSHIGDNGPDERFIPLDGGNPKNPGVWMFDSDLDDSRKTGRAGAKLVGMQGRGSPFIPETSASASLVSSNLIETGRRPQWIAEKRVYDSNIFRMYVKQRKGTLIYLEYYFVDLDLISGNIT